MQVVKYLIPIHCSFKKGYIVSDNALFYLFSYPPGQAGGWGWGYIHTPYIHTPYSPFGNQNRASKVEEILNKYCSVYPHPAFCPAG